MSEPVAQVGAEPIQRDMQLVAELASRWMVADSEMDVYAGLAEGLRQVVGDQAVISVSNCDRASQALMPQILVGLGPRAEKLSALLGKDPINLVGDFSPEVKREMASGRLVRIEGGVAALSVDALPPVICRQAAKFLGLQEAYVVGFARQSCAGGVCIITREAGVVLRSATIEALVRVAAVAIERKQVETALRASEERFRFAFDDATLGKCLSAHDGRMLRVNKALCDMLDHTPDELVGQRLLAFTHPEDRSLVSRGVRREVVEKRYLAKGDRVGYAQVSAALVMTPDGDSTCCLSEILDITESKRTSEALRQSEEKYRLLVEHADCSSSVVTRHRPIRRGRRNPRNGGCCSSTAKRVTPSGTT